MSLGSEFNRVRRPYEGGLSIVPTSVSTSFTAAESSGGHYWKASPENARLQSSVIIFEQDATRVNSYPMSFLVSRLLNASLGVFNYKLLRLFPTLTPTQVCQSAPEKIATICDGFDAGA
ncbi:hypothetical protein ALP71_200247 [Pseudomonas coronafaciens pv. garcae]|nr:hypothetical protein ALP71_200247 [Pseudomonas coronafaciens pv. garcae]